MNIHRSSFLLLLSASFGFSFVTTNIGVSKKSFQLASTETDTVSVYDAIQEKRKKQKLELLKLLGGSPSIPTTPNASFDPVLARPDTKEALQIITESPILEGGASGVKVTLRSSPESDKTYEGRTDTFFNLLESKEEIIDAGTDSENDQNVLIKDAINALRVFIPPPLRMAGAMAGVDDSYVPMRDLFTSPAVSFAYERGWRQGFAAAGFPGADEEYQMVRDFFEPCITGTNKNVVVDMSCATGLFTRRLAKSGDYTRVLGCDYSESMLTEARRRIQLDPDIKKSSTRLDLVRLDVGNLPMQSESVDALHAGAAMHCWPDLDAGLSEIYRVLKANGGRYFASTFLSEYFRTVRATDGNSVNVNQQAFQYFESTDQLKEMLLKAGFEESNIDIEVLGTACVIIKCIK